MTYPAVIREVKTHLPFNYSITIHEGRKRQVRRMFEKLGHRVRALKRIRIGDLSLGNLGEGETRELTIQEVKTLLLGVPVIGRNGHKMSAPCGM
jgi:23S rRNA pseudouridine2605 synthase